MLEIVTVRAAVLFAFLVVLTGYAACGCASSRDAYVNAANASAAFGTATEASFATLYEHEQRQCLPEPRPADCVDVVRLLWQPRWSAYRTFRARWLALAAALRVGNDIEVATRAASLARAEVELAKAIEASP